MGCDSSFGGTIDEIPGISVDNFENLGKRAYFLSHIHSDHTAGLRNTVRFGDNVNADFADYLSKNHVFIYMSDITAKIFEYEFSDLVAFIKPLEMGKPQVITLPSTKTYEELHIGITLIPAGHCLGSSMILFQSNKKTVLYTGDFRYTQNDVSKIRDLHNPKDRTEPLHIDTMYVDTTFLAIDKEHLPKRSESIDYLLKEVADWLKKGEKYKVALSTSAKYGYEFVFNEIYEKLGRKVYVTDAKWPPYSKMADSLPGVTNDKNYVDIHNCSFYSKNHNKCEIPNADKYIFLNIRLSAMKWSDCSIEEVPVDKSNDNNISICFSTHSSRSELIHFVNHFAPKRVVGFPNEYKIVKTPRKQVDVVLLPVKRRKVGKATF